MISLYVLFAVFVLYAQSAAISIPVSLRIIGGNESTIEDHPWQVSIQLFRRHFCSGSIIGEDTILTAAHCITALLASAYQIIVGKTDLSAPADPVYRVERFITHINYTGDNNFDDDIAVLKLTTSLVFSDEVQPISLPEDDFDIPIGTNVIASGWGVTTSGDDTPSKVLRDVSLQIVDRERCKETLSKAGPVTENMVCAGDPNGGKDACEYDSGGPLEYNGMLIGIVSWGDGCGRKGVPGVYTNVAKLRQWIRQQTGI